jgi:hypothetical protein
MIQRARRKLDIFATFLACALALMLLSPAAADSWRDAFNTLPRPLPDHRLGIDSVILKDGRVLIIGGFIQDEHHLVPLLARPETEIYNPITGAFTPTGDMASPRCQTAPAVLPNDQVLVVGGVTCVNWDRNVARLVGATVFKTAELFDAANGSFERVGDMTVARVCPALVVLRDGKVLVIGGQPHFLNGGMTSVELFDPATATFHLNGNLQYGRACAQAKLLDDGKVLVTDGLVRGLPGGVADVGINQTEIYDPVTGTSIVSTP